jgi:hypothetical protein
MRICYGKQAQSQRLAWWRLLHNTGNHWHIYEVGMAGDDEISGTIAAPFTPEMGEAIKRIVVAINDAYALARRLRAKAVDQSNAPLTES